MTVEKKDKNNMYYSSNGAVGDDKTAAQQQTSAAAAASPAAPQTSQSNTRGRKISSGGFLGAIAASFSSGSQNNQGIQKPGRVGSTAGSLGLKRSSPNGSFSSDNTSVRKMSISSQNQRPVRTVDDVVYQGFLMKRGEHIRNWRQRYFILFKDGALLGFKTKPENNNYSEPLNDFTVKDVQIMKVERPKPNTIMVRGLQWTTVIERMFHAESAQVRDEWIEAIKVSKKDF